VSARNRRPVQRYCGVGGDGQHYGVLTLSTPGGRYQRQPCKTCPWRRDAEIGRFPAQAYRESAHVAYDAAFNTFACHEAGVKSPATCAGFIVVTSLNNISVRLALASGRLTAQRVGTPQGVALYANYREMAVANGVDNDDPVLALCRADDE
jgi:hypothetical protein